MSDMNLARSLSRHQLFYLKLVCSGEMVIVWHEPNEGYVEIYRGARGDEHIGITFADSKTRGRNLFKCGNHKSSSIIELRQRGVLIDVGGRLLPNRDAARQFGTPPPLPVPKHIITMSRTRAARVQVVEEDDHAAE